MPHFLQDDKLKLMLFGGKGGTGKTTCATATAIYMAKARPQARLLLVSTDPAHSVMDCLAGDPPPVNLKILELDAKECLANFKEKHNLKLKEIAARGTFLDDEDINRLLDLSLPGLDELMAFIEISRWVEEESYDCIIVDTAPTGHTLRLLEMPELIRRWLGMLEALLAKHRYMKKIFQKLPHKDELDIFLEDLAISVEQMERLLRNSSHCRFIPVMLAESLIITETAMLVDKLEELEIPVLDIIINRLYRESECPACASWNISQTEEIKKMLGGQKLSHYVLWGVPLYSVEMRGQASLSLFWEHSAEVDLDNVFPSAKNNPPALRVEIAHNLPNPDLTFLLFAGKGGVGKTTLACATAMRLAHELKGKELLLFSTDPAHSLSACLGRSVGAIPRRICQGLTAIEIDAKAEFDTLKEKYEQELQELLQSLLSNVDLTYDREVMERMLDVSPPGLDEVMALTRVMEFLDSRKYDVFVLDSAPTGHLIRLLELPELIDQWLKTFFGIFLKYKNIFRLPKMSRHLIRMSKNLKKLSALLRDSQKSALYAVSIQTEMAFQETYDLITSCHKMGINTAMLFLNLAIYPNKCPLCAALSERESAARKKFSLAFPDMRQTIIYRQGNLQGIKKLEHLGEILYKPVLKENLAHAN